MQANPNTDLDQDYQNLTEKQKAVIDAHAKNPDATNREKARIAGVEILGEDEPINESYTSEILNKDHAELAKYREEIEQNERVEGQQQTIGDPFKSLQQQQQDQGQGFQSIQERPVKQTTPESDETEDTPQVQQPQVQQRTKSQPIQSTSPIQVADTGDGIVVKFSYGYLQDQLQRPDSQLPDELQQQLVDVMFQRAFA